MYIAPSSQICILRNVPLDAMQEHTLYFANASAQYTYFYSLQKYKVANSYYQRANRNYIRAPYSTDDLYDCNYLMFQNTSFGNKWFYAYITAVNYVNNGVTEIEYELDVMQTWFFDYKLDYCYIDRQHTVTDNPGDNIVPEDLEAGNEYTVFTQNIFDCNPKKIALIATTGPNGEKPSAGPIAGVYMPLHYHEGNVVADLDFINYVNSYIVNGRENAIVAIYQFPSWITDGFWYTTYIPNRTAITSGVFPYAGTSGGYLPRNNKLYTAPYNIMTVDNSQGQSATFAFENWPADHKCEFTIFGTSIGTVQVICAPEDYLRDPGYGLGNKGTNYEYALTMSNFPQNAWNGDVYKAWLAQNRASVNVAQQASVMSSYVSGATGAISNLMSLNPLGAVGSIAQSAFSIKNTIDALNAKKQDLRNTPPQAHGQTQTETLNAAIGRYAFVFKNKRIKGEYAKVIDSYFDRYGYAIHANGIPNINARPHWTYVKTVGCNLHGSIPQDDLRKICSIYDSGITFWRNPAEVNNYSLSNSPA